MDYDFIGELHEGLMRVKKDDKWGYINKGSQEIISPRYDNAWGFSCGVARIKQNGKYGYINKLGQEVIPPIYDEARRYFGGLIRAKKTINAILLVAGVGFMIMLGLFLSVW